MKQRKKENARRNRIERYWEIKAKRSKLSYRIRDAERRRKKYREQNGPPRQPQGALRDVDYEAYLKRRREWYADKMANDPEWREQRREYSRMYQTIKRREAGVQPRQLSERPAYNPGRGRRLPADPMIHWIRSRIVWYDNNVSMMADYCDVDEATIRRLRDGKVTTIYLDIADKILVEDGSADLWMIYPHLYDESVEDAKDS